MEFLRVFTFSFYSLFALTQGLNLVASDLSKEDEVARSGYRAPHASMAATPQVSDLQALSQAAHSIGLSPKLAQKPVKHGIKDDCRQASDESEQAIKSKEASKKSPKKSINIKGKIEKNNRIMEADIEAAARKEVAKKEQDAKASQAVKKYKRMIETEQAELRDEKAEEESDRESMDASSSSASSSAPQYVILKAAGSQPTEPEIYTLDEISQRPNFIPLSDLDLLLEPQPKKKTFFLPTLEAWELILILSAGKEPGTGMTYKVRLPDRDTPNYKYTCNYKSLLQGKREEDLVPFLKLNEFRESSSLAILKKHLVITEQKVKKLSPIDLQEIKKAKFSFQQEIEALGLKSAGARPISDERREVSTLAGQESRLTEYQLTEGRYGVHGVLLSLTLYRQK